MTTDTCSRIALDPTPLSLTCGWNMNVVPSSSLTRQSSEDSLDRVAKIAPAPLLPGEKEADYLALVARIVAVAQPRDAIEELLTRDVIDLSWEILRLRRMKSGLLRASIGVGIGRVMRSLGKGYSQANELGPSWAAGEKRAHVEVAAALQKAQLSIEDVMAETLESKIDSFERFDRMLVLRILETNHVRGD